MFFSPLQYFQKTNLLNKEEIMYQYRSIFSRFFLTLQFYLGFFFVVVVAIVLLLVRLVGFLFVL